MRQELENSFPEDLADIPTDDTPDSEWDTVRDESATVILFSKPGQRFVGHYEGIEEITPENDEPFTRHRFTGLNGKPYAVNNSYVLQEGLKNVQKGNLVRLTYVKDIPTGKNMNPMKDIKVQVKR